MIFVVGAEGTSARALAKALQATENHTDRVSELAARHPDARFVYLHRDADATAQLLDDLEQLPPDRWGVVNEQVFIRNPETEIRRLCAFLGIDAPDSFPPALRARELMATPDKPSPFRSVATSSFAQILQHLGVSLVVTTYQSGRLVFVRAANASTLNTHFRMFRSPMGVAIGHNRIALGCEREIWDYRNVPQVARTLQPQGLHDACFIPRNVHYTGDIRIHEVGFAADGELWAVNTRFSTLCTIDREHSFVPRWRPPFITHLAAEDRCHLNGMAIVDGAVKYVTALGETNVAGGWRETKASGGIVMEVPSGRIVLRGLSMPHSPRIYSDRFWLLESGKGEVNRADLASGTIETIAQLPGFTRGLAFAGPFAFVGLSQVRESNVFGGIPLVDRVAERKCGVWVIDLRTRDVAAFLQFEGDVREIFDVQVLPRMRYPELLEANDDLVGVSYVLPDEALPDVARPRA